MELLVKEDGTYFNSKEIEYVEQFMSEVYVEENDKVLELGARYGSVSIVTNRKLKNKTDHVVVEPDETVWSSLEQNKNTYNCEFQIVKGVLSETPKYLKPDGYCTRQTGDSNDKLVPNISLNDINHIQFNVLIADCEGALESFFDEYPFMYDQVNKVLMEEDGNCDYKKIKMNLMRRGFIKMFEYGDFYGLLHSVWFKVSNQPMNYIVRHVPE